MNARTVVVLLATLLSLGAAAAFDAESNRTATSDQAPGAEPAPACSESDRRPPPTTFETAASDAAPAAPAPSREKPRPNRRPTWPPPPELIA